MKKSAASASPDKLTLKFEPDMGLLLAEGSDGTVDVLSWEVDATGTEDSPCCCMADVLLVRALD
jgi:hypothetical protein